MKKFIKPTVSKIILFIIFLVLSTIIPFESFLGSWVKDGPIFNYETIICGEQMFSCAPQIYSFYVIFNLIFYYLLSCLIIWLISKFTRSRNLTS